MSQLTLQQATRRANAEFPTNAEAAALATEELRGTIGDDGRTRLQAIREERAATGEFASGLSKLTRAEGSGTLGITVDKITKKVSFTSLDIQGAGAPTAFFLAVPAGSEVVLLRVVKWMDGNWRGVGRDVISSESVDASIAELKGRFSDAASPIPNLDTISAVMNYAVRMWTDDFK